MTPPAIANRQVSQAKCHQDTTFNHHPLKREGRAVPCSMAVMSLELRWV
jgi:hypothetical protein